MRHQLHHAQLRFPTHEVSIRVDPDTLRIHVFKTTAQACDFMVFEYKDKFEASDYILDRPQASHYRVEFPGE